MTGLSRAGAAALGVRRQSVGHGRAAPASSRPDPRGATGARPAAVTVVGGITRTFGAYVLQLGDAPSDPLIVVLQRAKPFLAGQRLAVSGDVRTFRRVELESELAVDLGCETSGLEGQRCLLAHSVRPD